MHFGNAGDGTDVAVGQAVTGVQRHVGPADLLTGGDPRFRLVTHEEALSITLDEVDRWLDDVICPAPIELSIVGDISQDTAMGLALRFLGSLPQRPARDQGLDSLRQLRGERGPLESTLEVETVADRAAVLSGWRAAPWSEGRDRELLLMAEQVLMQRLQGELREKRGLTYSANCSFSPSKAYPNASFLSVAFYTSPGRVQEAVGVTRRLVETLADQGPTVGEMETVRKELGDLVKRFFRDPKYWGRVLADLDYHGTRLDDLKTMRERLLAVTGSDLREALQRYIVEERRIQVVCIPRESSS